MVSETRAKNCQLDENQVENPSLSEITTCVREQLRHYVDVSHRVFRPTVRLIFFLLGLGNFGWCDSSKTFNVV